jgi:nicotinate phosphoribosyltransferase
MGQFVFKNFKDTKLGVITISAMQQLQEVQKLKFQTEEIEYLRSLKLFSEDYLKFLSELKLPDVDVNRTDDGELSVQIKCLWKEGIYWETIILSIINELHFEASKYLPDIKPFKTGENKLSEKIEILKQNPQVKFTDFGTRRRFSFEWHEHVLDRLVKECPEQLLGTSNAYFAYKFGIKPIGTMAHECFMGGSRLFGDYDIDILNSHNRILDMWYEMYGYGLSIALTDTYGSDYTFNTFGKERAEKWKGLRQDSGDPFEFARKQIKMYESYGIDPKTKYFVPSDGLTLPIIIDLFKEFGDKINVSPGWGTSLTNDCGVKPLSIVIKVTEVNGKGTVKLSDNISKATGKKEDIERFKRIFDYTNVKAQEIVY